MRKAGTFVQTKDGKWECIATPDVSLDDQKKALKKLNTAGGKSGSKQYVNGIILSNTGVVKRMRFKDKAGKSEKKQEPRGKVEGRDSATLEKLARKRLAPMYEREEKERAEKLAKRQRDNEALKKAAAENKKPSAKK